MTYNLLQPPQADQFQLTDEDLQESVEDGRFDLSEVNRFNPKLYIASGERELPRFVAALLFILFFVITVPVGLWRWNNVGRILASLWLVSLCYLGYDFYVNKHMDWAALLPQITLGLPRVVAENTTSLPEIALPTVTPTPDMKQVVAARTPVLLPTPTHTPVPLPTVTPWTDNPQWAVVTQGRLNMRAAPVADAEIIGKLVTTACVQVITTEAEWLEVRQSSGEQGWSAKQFFEFVPFCPPISTP